MQDKATIADLIILYGGVALAWLTGEGGRVSVAAGAGGLVRWLSSERRRIRDGMIAVITGLVVGQYMWPAVLHFPSLFGRDAYPETPNSIAMAAFVAGTVGMSAVKILIAVVEARGSRLASENHGKEEDHG